MSKYAVITNFLIKMKVKQTEWQPGIFCIDRQDTLM